MVLPWLVLVSQIAELPRAELPIHLVNLVKQVIRDAWADRLEGGQAVIRARVQCAHATPIMGRTLALLSSLFFAMALLLSRITKVLAAKDAKIADLTQRLAVASANDAADAAAIAEAQAAAEAAKAAAEASATKAAELQQAVDADTAEDAQISDLLALHEEPEQPEPQG